MHNNEVSTNKSLRFDYARTLILGSILEASIEREYPYIYL